MPKNALVIATPSYNNTRDDSTHRYHKTVNTQIRLIIFFETKGGEALYSQEKNKKRLGEDYGSDLELLIANSDLN